MAFDLTRRRLIGGIGVMLCAPMIVQASSIMPVRAFPKPQMISLATIDDHSFILDYVDLLDVPEFAVRHSPIVIGRPPRLPYPRQPRTPDFFDALFRKAV